MNQNQTLDELAKELEEKLAAVRDIQGILARHPDLVDRLASVHSTERPVTPSVPEKRPSTEANGKLSHVEQIVAFLRSQGNQPKTAKDIAAGTGISRNSATYVLYSSPKHKDRFEKITGDDGVHQWRLNDAGLAAYGSAAGKATQEIAGPAPGHACESCEPISKSTGLASARSSLNRLESRMGH